MAIWNLLKLEDWQENALGWTVMVRTACPFKEQGGKGDLQGIVSVYQESFFMCAFLLFLLSCLCRFWIWHRISGWSKLRCQDLSKMGWGWGWGWGSSRRCHKYTGVRGSPFALGKVEAEKWQLTQATTVSIKSALGFCEGHYGWVCLQWRSQVEWYIPTLQNNAIKKKKVSMHLHRHGKKSSGHSTNF